MTDNRIYGKELLMLLIAAVILMAGAYFLGPSITSFVIKEFSYSDEINLVVTSSGNYTWQPANIGDLKSLKIDGRMTTYGKARAYIESDGIKYLIFDSARLNESTIESSNNSITGFAVKEESGREKKDKNKKPEWIGADEFDVNGTALINLSEQFFDKDGDLLVYAVSEAEGLKTSIGNEMATIAPESDDSFNTTITFIASDGTASASHIAGLRVNARIGIIENINITPIINLTINQTANNTPVNPTINESASILNQTVNETINITINETINLTQPINETANATVTNETSLAADNITKTIAISLSYGSGTVYDANDDGEESVNGVVDLSVSGTKFSWNADESKLCTRWEVYNAEKESLTAFCNGNSGCCAFASLLPTKSNWSETYYSAFGKDNAGYSNTVSAQVIYYDVNLSIESPKSEIYYSEWGNKSARFFEDEAEFLGECIDTCSLSGLNKSAYKLVFEIEDGAVLRIGRIRYNVLADVENKAPVLLQNFSAINVGKNGNAAINLSQYFADPDGDMLSYNYYRADNITISFEKDIAAIAPDRNFEGARFTFITANDSEKSIASNLFIVNVSALQVGISPAYFFEVRGSADEKLAVFDSFGNLKIKGSLIQGLPPIADENDFAVQNSTNGLNAVITNPEGGMMIKEFLYENQNELAPTPNSFIIENKEGSYAAYINSTGSLFLKGILTENAIFD